MLKTHTLIGLSHEQKKIAESHLCEILIKHGVQNQTFSFLFMQHSSCLFFLFSFKKSLCYDELAVRHRNVMKDRSVIICIEM